MGVAFLTAGELAVSAVPPALAAQPTDFPTASAVFVPGNGDCEGSIGETPENSEGDCVDAIACEMPVITGGELIGNAEAECGGNGAAPLLDLFACTCCLSLPGILGDLSLWF